MSNVSLKFMLPRVPDVADVKHYRVSKWTLFYLFLL